MVEQSVKLRHARENDCKLLWEWANDLDVRAVSFSRGSIPWETHVEWFRSKRDNPSCAFYIATVGAETPIGQIRFDLKGDQAVVSISVGREHRGKGYGSLLVRLSAGELFRTTAVTAIHAYVKRGNETSVRAFERAGYQNLGAITVEGEEAFQLFLSRSDQDDCGRNRN
ncbi:MAG: GNAT family N-acetyltransferase [Deltaproteobacteria bacterium]|nr:GNAT family N-acetyltransferase [Deltaproteobacteria bacterium]